MASILKNLGFTLIGLVFFKVFILYALLCLPLHLYRWIVCKVLAPLFNKKLGKALSLLGATMGTEIVGEYIRKPPTCTIVTSFCAEGTLDFEELQERVLENWINRKREDGFLVYPEFQQYVVGWMGYLFWKTDEKFDIKNHMKKYVLEETATEEECQRFLHSVQEDNINKLFSPERSPWSFDFIYNYKNSELLPSGKVMTVGVLRVHHALADGFAIFSAFFEGLFGVPMKDCQLAAPQKVNKKVPIKKSKVLSKIINRLTFPLRACRDAGFALYVTFTSPKTPWHVADKDKNGKFIYSGSGMISISKMKKVKDAFGVSFTSVLMSSISAGISEAFKSKDFSIGKIPFSMPIPLKGHSYKLRNHATLALFKLPLDPELTSSERIIEAEKHFKYGRQSLLPFLLPLVTKVTLAHIYPVMRFLVKSKQFSTGSSNFPGSGVGLVLNGHRFITKEFGVGLPFGNSGVGFYTLSYNGHLRLVVVAEEAAMKRAEVEEMIGVITQEIDKLNELATQKEYFHEKENDQFTIV